jgi:glucose-6-phosphate isomerase
MLTDLPEWKALQAHRRAMDGAHMRDLFAQDAKRFDSFHIRTGGLLFDYSRHRVTGETMKLLLDLAQARDITGWLDRMFAGEKINTTEKRAVLHTALRRPPGDKVVTDGADIMPFVHETLKRMELFSSDVRRGRRTGHTGKKISTVVNIGIGGSDLGPYMACEALRHLPAGIAARFVSNVDGAHIVRTLADLDPETTLFIVASKTFTTQETMANAATAREWLQSVFGTDAIAKHFAAVTANEAAAAQFGIGPDAVFPLRDWAGGRYSLWSPVGLPVCLAYGFETFRALLNGAYEMDMHFRQAPIEANMPVIMALLGLWYRDFWDAQTLAVLPYAQNLHRLPAFLQQLEMESNGKSVDRDGKPVACPTAPVLFGEPGTNCQHSFMQMIHQGAALVPCDFIGFTASSAMAGDHHRMLLANMIAQAQALMQGRTLAESGNDPQKVFSGNRPSTALLFDRLDARHLGMLIALYEHKVFVQGILWNINSFDQWGVELGKSLATDILSAVVGSIPAGADATAKALLAYIGKLS